MARNKNREWYNYRQIQDTDADVRKPWNKRNRISADAPINIVLKNIDGAMLKEMKEYKQGLVTVKTAAANALGLDGLIKFSKSYKSGDSRMTLVREDDVATGFTTYSACYKFVGSQVIVR